MRTLVAVPNSICWTEVSDTHGFDGIPHNVTTLKECLNACTDMEDTCVAVDWEPSNNEHSCWILTTTTTEDSTETGVVTHYIPNRPTPSESRFGFTLLAIKLQHAYLWPPYVIGKAIYIFIL